MPSRGYPIAGRRPWSATSLFPRRWISDDDKSVLEKLSQPVADEGEEAAARADALFEKVEAALPLSVEAKVEEEA